MGKKHASQYANFGWLLPYGIETQEAYMVLQMGIVF